jgi:WhiB family transcriptional regulator, redox-sensing transcriptional regulator
MIRASQAVCPDRSYDWSVELLQTPVADTGVLPEARHVPSVAGVRPRPRSCAGARGPSRPVPASGRTGRRLTVPRVTSGASSVSWMSRGACREADPDLFFPIAVGAGPAARQAEAAKAVCGACAVRPDCLSYALKAEPEGIWGGATPEERRTARRRQSRRWVSAPSRGTASAAISVGNATLSGPAAAEQVTPGRTT